MGRRVESLILVGRTGSVSLTGSQFRTVAGLRSTWWSPTNAPRNGPSHDFDSDGQADVLARIASTGALLLYPGNGTGGFRAARVVGSGWGGMNALVGPGDWDGDGWPDLLARVGATGALLLYPGNGTGGFRAARIVGSGWGGIDALV